MQHPTVSDIRRLQVVLVLIGIGLLIRRQAVLLALILTLAILNLSVFREQVGTAIRKDQLVTESRFRKLREALPVNGHVGFITDEVGDGLVARYYLTQYALAPIVVEEGTSRDLVIGNFRKFDPHLVPVTLLLVADFGDGLLLFRRKPE